MFFKCKFDVDVPGPDDPEANGDLFDHEYSFYRRGEVVARVLLMLCARMHSAVLMLSLLELPTLGIF